MTTIATLVKIFSYMGTIVLLFAGKLSSMRAQRLYPHDFDKQEEENDSLKYDIPGCICMLIYLVIIIVSLCRRTFQLYDIPCITFGIAIILAILNLDEIQVVIKWIIFLVALTMISVLFI